MNRTYLGSLIVVLLGLTFGGPPADAQTCDVTWRKADNPRVISGTVTIPAGQTVCVEPGVRVEFRANGKLVLDGRLVAAGTATERIEFAGVNVSPNRVEVVGSLELQFADVTVPLNVNPGASLTSRDCNFRARGGIFTLAGIVFSYTPTFVSVENSTFDSNAAINSDNAAFYVSDATIVLRNTEFRNGAYCNIGKSNLYLDGITSQNARFDGLEIQQNNFQPQLIDNVSVTGAGDAGLHLLAGNFELGPNVTLQNNEYPIRGGGGLLPASNVPATGNQNNWIELTGFQPYSVYAPFAIPYVASGARISQTEILPGAVIKLRPDVKIDTFGNPHVEVLGLPDAPITFEPFVPSQKWNGMEFFQPGDRLEYTVLDGSRLGLYSSTTAGTSIYFDQTVLRQHDIAFNDTDFDLVYVQGSLINNNGIGVLSDGNGSTFRMSGETNPNLFENNGVGARAVNGATMDVRFNWWNSPTGPTTPLNPGGTGDRIEGNPMFQPFRTVRPDRTDHPPVVRMQRRPFLLSAGSFEGVIEPGQKVILRWDAFDNRTIVRQRVMLALNGNAKETFEVIYADLPGDQRSIEFTMPPSAGTAGGFNKFIRVVAVDDRGQEGWDELGIQVPSGTEPGELQITTPLAGRTFRSGEEFHVDWTITTPFNDPTFQVFLILDGNRRIELQANGNSTGTISTVKMPYISTDSARLAVKSQGSINNVKWFYSGPFAIRPDPRYPDAPPQVALTSPPAGQSFPAGAIVPISWTASDDEALRSFSILYSTDRGRTWLTLVENLPPTTTSYQWQTPPGTGFADVRVRVVAFDRRFQNSSDGADRAFPSTVAYPFSAWRTENFSEAELQNPAISGALADPSGAGIANLLRYVLGIPAKRPGVAGLPAVSVEEIGGNKYLTLTYTRSKLAGGVALAVQVSGSLEPGSAGSGWNSGPAHTTEVSRTDNGNGTETVVTRDNTPLSAAGSRFIRIRVSQ